MSVESFPNAKSIFLAAIEIASAADREAFLNAACQGDDSLRRRVVELIAAHEASASLLDRAAPGPPPDVPGQETVDLSNGNGPGARIGPYKLLQQLGEGGMGVVYLAERQQPVKQRVALKIIKQGMDSRKFIARFEAERQALAMMDHPNIAKVLDAGCTESGRPYFVMELVKGIPISAFCDENRLTTRDRLQLFVQVCQAVQHAHQKGIIHRDLKPSNVLVALYDQKPVPKVIDFGVAKATSQQLTEKTLFTEVGSILGTWEYMSPEQAVLNQVDVDTRTDVYSLGVLLYELLTGETPLDRQRLREAQLMETLRMIREEEPPKPSTRISSLGRRATATAAYRKAKPEALAAEMRGDLDWIVMKAMAKERGRRYDSVSRLGEDIERYLNNELVEARPPSAWYQLQKFYARNRALALGVAAVVTALGLGLVGVGAMNVRLASTQRELREKHERLDATLVRLVDSTMREAVVAALGGDVQRAEAALDLAREAGAREGDVLLVQGLLAMNRAEYDLAIELARQSRQAPSSIQGDERVGATAIFTAAGLWGGQIGMVEPEILRLLAANPEHDIEKLLQAYALAGYNPRKSLEVLETNPAVERTPVGLFVRGQAEFQVAVDEGDRRKFESAMEDLRFAQFLLQDAGATLVWRALALHTAIKYGRVDGRNEDAKLHESDARSMLKLLEQPATPSTSAWPLYALSDALGDEDGAFRACRLNPTTADGLLEIECLRRFDYPQAATLFKSMTAGKDVSAKGVRLVQAHIVRGEENGDRKVRELVTDLLQEPAPYTRRFALAALCLACTPEELEQLAKDSQKAISGEMYALDYLWRGEASVRYYAGEITPEALIEQAGNHRYALANFHCTIAMKCLAQRDRAGALHHFQAAVDTQTFMSVDYELARAYVTRMKADDRWPSWLAAPVSGS